MGHRALREGAPLKIKIDGSSGFARNLAATLGCGDGLPLAVVGGDEPPVQAANQHWFKIGSPQGGEEPSHSCATFS